MESVFTLERKNFASPETLCWFCGNSIGACRWASSFQPVPGWTATPTRKNGNDSFFVSACPEFVPDRAAREVAKPRGETVPAKGFDAEARERFLLKTRRSRSRKSKVGAQRFLAALDSGCSVSRAAKRAGVSLSAAYEWLKILRGETT